ncbi:MAG TPA: redox-sensing transcriptional repressor Rex [Caldithrix abyssi]|uniref:Redox-sensing transcriptional repressor Rex n=1 Tax=Caldithrix abyssi TaxID=187145 RepID=A0A7V5VE91_CALAY|nr:redox-sensing transcriptional repressor Rex [Caldithrix abyssi]
MKKISGSTVTRLSQYYRILNDLIENNVETVSSSEIAQINSITAAQVRKDLSFFGSFGKRGLGYNTRELRNTIAGILGLHKKWNVALVGFGNIGRALLLYDEFRKQGFLFQAIFEVDENKIGRRVHGVDIVHVKEAPQILFSKEIEIVIIAVPAKNAQGIIDFFVGLGIKAFLNFATTSIHVPKDVIVKNENMSIELEALTYFLTNKK